jgi:hypothetical protein
MWSALRGPENFLNIPLQFHWLQLGSSESHPNILPPLLYFTPDSHYVTHCFLSIWLTTLSCYVDSGDSDILPALFRKEVLIQGNAIRSKKFLLNGIKWMVTVKQHVKGTPQGYGNKITLIYYARHLHFLN